MTIFRYALIISALALMLAVCGCGGGTKAISAITVRATPTSATVPQGATQNITASVTGTTNTAVTWSLQEGVVGGTITQAGIYTAPLTVGIYHVIATSNANTTKTAIITITVPSVAINVSPLTVSIAKAASSTFVATVTGTANTAVTWSLQEGAAAGTITQTGIYTAPSTAGTFHVIATSKADVTKSGSATVTVN